MADYAIGDVQGCFDALQRLLDVLHFNEHTDRLWFVGDLVNRGPQSLDVLRFVKALPLAPRISLGNHDLYLLSIVFNPQPPKKHDPSLTELINAPDCEPLCHWLRQQKLLVWDADLKVVMTHAGIAPMWSLTEAQAYAQELERVLSGPHYRDFLTQMYGNTPNPWSSTLTGFDRLRAICNYLTRMRFCFADGRLDFEHQGPLNSASAELYPWFSLPHRVALDADVVFGHWAALNGQCSHPNMYAIDTGCVWGGSLTALRLQDKYRVSVSSL